MSLIGTVLSGLLGGQSGGSGLQNVLTSILSGQGAAGQGGAGQGFPGQGFPGQGGAGQGGAGQGGFGGQGGMGGGGLAGGGLGGLISAFQQAGLGDVIGSWVNHGQNQPVSPDQLQNVFGEQRVNDMASQSGMSSSDFLSQLSQHLPRAVDGITPNGRLPDEGTVSV